MWRELTLTDLEWFQLQETWVLPLYEKLGYEDHDDYMFFPGFDKGKAEAQRFIAWWSLDAYRTCLVADITPKQWWIVVSSLEPVK